MSATRGAFALIGLMALFLMMLPVLHLADVVIALVIGALSLLLLGPMSWLRGRVRLKWSVVSALARLPLELLRQSVIGGWRITRLTFGLGSPPVPGIVELDVGDRSAEAAALLGLFLTLVPGTLLIDIDPQRNVMRFHVAGADRNAFVRSAERIYALQRRVLP